MAYFHTNDTEAQKALRSVAFVLCKEFFRKCANDNLSVDQHKGALVTLQADLSAVMTGVVDPVYSKGFQDNVGYALAVAAPYNATEAVMPIGESLLTHFRNTAKAHGY